MERIEATGAKACTDCRLEMPIKDVYIRGNQVVILTQCTGCQQEYTSKFLWPNRVLEGFRVRNMG